MKITKKVEAKDYVFHIEKVNEEIFLTAEFSGRLELISKKNMTCLSSLKLKWDVGI